jgi:DNA-cytosine methyltransferase
MPEGFHPLTYLSVCSGIEAATVAWEPLGWQALGFAEIDKFPSAVLAHHYPEVKNYGDFTKIELKDLPSRPDILVGGTPCQDFSVAGLRAGLGGDRGNLTLEFLRLADRLRPKYIVWENVPGVLSIDHGKTIQKVIDTLTQIGYICDIDIHDAQEFGVPQRRRRVFIVCVKLEDLLLTKTNISDRIVLELLVQGWQPTWDAALAVLSRAKSPSASEYPTAQPVDFLQKRMQLLNDLLGGSVSAKLLSYWGAPQAQSMVELISSASASPQSNARPQDESKTDTGGLSKIVTADEFGCKNTEAKWESLLDAISAQMNPSTTSTLSVETMETKISSFAEALLTTLLSITNSSELSQTRTWSSDYWNLASSLLILTKGITTYARPASYEMLCNQSVRDSWGACVKLSQTLTDILERHIGKWVCSHEILLVKNRLCRHTPPSREKRESAPTIPSRRTAGGGLGTDFDCDGGLIPTAFGGNNTSGPIDVAAACNAHGGPNGKATGSATQQDAETGMIVTHSLRADGFDASKDGTGRGTPLVPVTFDDQRGRANAGIGIDQARTLHVAKGPSEVQLVAFSCKNDATGSGPLSPAQRSMNFDRSHANAEGQVAVAFNLRGREGGSQAEMADQASVRAASGGSSRSYVAVGLDEEQNAVEDGMGCLKARREGGGFKGSVMTPSMQVRRLTPTECERLQKFPDGYTKISDKTADGPRYKALGNSMAVCCMEWIGRRIRLVDLFS